MKSTVLYGLLAILIAISLHASLKSDLEYLETLNDSQRLVLYKTFNKASQYDLEYTMTAIAWTESHFGLLPLNLADPSAGVFHNSLKSVASRINEPHNEWSYSRIAERLLFDYNFAFSQALAELRYWQGYWKKKKVTRKWSHTVRSYNAGTTGKGEAYLRVIRSKIKALRIYLKD